MRNLVFDFKCRLNLSDNDLVKSTLLKNVADGSKLRKYWNELLLVQGK